MPGPYRGERAAWRDAGDGRGFLRFHPLPAAGSALGSGWLPAHSTSRVESARRNRACLSPAKRHADRSLVALPPAGACSADSFGQVAGAGWSVRRFQLGFSSLAEHDLQVDSLQANSRGGDAGDASRPSSNRLHDNSYADSEHSSRAVRARSVQVAGGRGLTASRARQSANQLSALNVLERAVAHRTCAAARF